ncbi:MAG TPA: hypothetical protein VE422_24520 [Terriglobia bacterium]|nr:hypothetical protein [Terriglobia bacterium]
MADVIKHKGTKAQRKAAIKGSFEAAFLCAFVPLCFVSLSLAVFFLPALPATAQSPPNDSYLRAVAEMVQPTLDDVSGSLERVDPSIPVRVVTWTRSGALREMKDPRRWVRKAPYDIWVTVVPRLRSFCQAFAKSRSASLDQLTLRLEQRLGLPPGGNKDVFIELIVKKPASSRNLFRPCMNPSTTTTTCKPGPPLSTARKDYQDWFYKQYYSSYANLRQQYPWTALGYTFDWALDESGGSKFVRIGESEFVIPKGASIEIQSETRTAEYCTPQ